MKKFQILIIIFIILTLSGLMGCACGYFTDKSDLDGSKIDNTGDIATTSSDNPGTGDSQKGTGDSQNNTVVITSTRKDETNSAAFIEPFLASFDGIGDANSDGKVSFAEAFNHASNNVSDQYINNNWGTITEHAQLDDNGDAISHEAPVPSGGDGQLAEDIYLK